MAELTDPPQAKDSEQELPPPLSRAQQYQESQRLKRERYTRDKESKRDQYQAGKKQRAAREINEAPPPPTKRESPRQPDPVPPPMPQQAGVDPTVLMKLAAIEQKIDVLTMRLANLQLGYGS